VGAETRSAVRAAQALAARVGGGASWFGLWSGHRWELRREWEWRFEQGSNYRERMGTSAKGSFREWGADAPQCAAGSRAPAPTGIAQRWEQRERCAAVFTASPARPARKEPFAIGTAPARDFEAASGAKETTILAC
jgi:hypothetical protein